MPSKHPRTEGLVVVKLSPQSYALLRALAARNHQTVYTFVQTAIATAVMDAVETATPLTPPAVEGAGGVRPPPLRATRRVMVLLPVDVHAALSAMAVEQQTTKASLMRNALELAAQDCGAETALFPATMANGRAWHRRSVHRAPPTMTGIASRVPIGLWRNYRHGQGDPPDDDE